MNSNFITRKEIAQMLGVSVLTVIRKETAWQLRDLRSNASRRPFLYFRGRVMRLLTQRGMIGE